ncbi:MAG: fumarylacetoacetate hydrolase family protein [Pyrinomonadaceae bacterium]
MKIVRFEFNSALYFGAILGQVIQPFNDSRIDLQNVLGAIPLESSLALSEVAIKEPCAPSKIVCVGRNYAAHTAELGNEVPKAPLLFLKAPSAVVSSGSNVKIPHQSQQVEHEGELAVIIGRTAKDISEMDDPLSYVFGYTCLNDVTARDVQRADIQFTRGKSFDTFCPVGPAIETELSPESLHIETRVNGEIKQSGNTNQMIFDIPFLIRYISQQMTLNSGDLIATGTPSGVSQLKRGDVCEVEIEHIGILRNPIK